jgi:hypothetical protein
MPPDFETYPVTERGLTGGKEYAIFEKPVFGCFYAPRRPHKYEYTGIIQ